MHDTVFNLAHNIHLVVLDVSLIQVFLINLDAMNNELIIEE